MMDSMGVDDDGVSQSTSSVTKPRVKNETLTLLLFELAYVAALLRQQDFGKSQVIRPKFTSNGWSWMYPIECTIVLSKSCPSFTQNKVSPLERSFSSQSFIQSFEPFPFLSSFLAFITVVGRRPSGLVHQHSTP
jgi:hypothetical protein